MDADERALCFPSASVARGNNQLERKASHPSPTAVNGIAGKQHVNDTLYHAPQNASSTMMQRAWLDT